jgi:hypothetical protein
MDQPDDALPAIYFDESGNTGPALLDERQPIFALASVNLSDETASSLLEPLGDGQDEIKFSVLRNDGARSAKLMEMLGSPVLTPEVARVSVFHKPYTTVAKLCDLLMEPGFYRRGLGDEWRTDGSTLKWPTTLYENATEQIGTTWPALLAAFVDAVRRPAPQKTADVRRLIDEGLKKAPDARVEFPLLVMREEVGEELGRFYDDRGKPLRHLVDPLDPGVSGLVEHLLSWGEKLGPFHARHDASTSMERAAPYIRKLCDPSMEPYEVTGPDGSVGRFPLKARDIEFVDSTNSAQVQVADLLAGACAYQQAAFEKTTTDFEFARAVATSGVRRLFVQFVAPPDFVRRSMDGVADL